MFQRSEKPQIKDTSQRVAAARDATALALKAGRKLREAIRDTNGTRPALVNALADAHGIERPFAI